MSNVREIGAGLLIASPIALAMMVASAALVAAASGLALAAALLSPVTGLVALGFMAPFPRPLEIPTPGLYAAIVAAILVGSVLRLPIDRPRLGLPSPVVVLLVAFLLYAAAHLGAWLLDGPPSERARDIGSTFAVFATGALAFVAANLALRGRSPFPMLAALLVSATLVAITGVAQSIGAEGVFGELMYESELHAETGRLTGPFSDPNYFGAFLAAAATLGVACATVARSAILKVLLITVAGVLGCVLVMTLSRGGLAAMVAGLVTIGFVRGRKTGVLALAAVLLAGAILWPLFVDVRSVHDQEVAGSSIASQLESSGRLGAWLAGMQVFGSSPLLGVGWGRFIEETTSGLVAHNWYISLLAELGAVGLVLWVMFVASAMQALRKRSSSARTVGYSVLATWVVASMFIEAPLVLGSSGLVLLVLAAALSADWPPVASSQNPPLVFDRLGRYRITRGG